MSPKSRMWYLIAVLLSAGNLAGMGYAIGVSEPLHAAAHVALVFGFGLWARRLRYGAGPGATAETTPLPDESQLDALMDEMSAMRRELNETQERLDFAERLLAQRPDPRRVE